MLSDVDAGEAESALERITRQKAQRAADGLAQGGRYRLYGYSKTWELLPKEAVIVREMFTRVGPGETAYAVGADLARRGLLTAAGKPWKSSSVTHVLSNRAYAGQRIYQGEVITKTAFLALISEADYALANDMRTRSVPRVQNFLLSGFTRCGGCGAPISGHSTRNRYRCNASAGGCGSVGLKRETLDDVITSLVLARENSPEPISEPLEPIWDLEAIDSEIAAIHAAYGRKELALADMTPILRDLREQRPPGHHARCAPAIRAPERLPLLPARSGLCQRPRSLTNLTRNPIREQQTHKQQAQPRPPTPTHVGDEAKTPIPDSS